MGHEASATVIEVDSSASLKPDDNVALEPGNPCRTCQRCVEGSYNLCSDIKFAASLYEEDGIIKQTPGTLSRYYVLPASLCYKLPDRITLSEGVFMEPLAVAVHACRMAQILHQPGHNTALIIGVGTIGVLTVGVACAFGAKSVLLVDVIPGKLESARNWLAKDGAGRIAGTLIDVYLADKEKSSEGNAREGIQAVKSQADAVIEASGAVSATAMCIYAVRVGGHVVQTGLSKESTMNGFPITDLIEKEIHLHGAFRYGHGDFEIARYLLSRSLIGDVKGLVGNVFRLDEYEDAWKATRDGNFGRGVKNLIEMKWQGH